MAEHDLIKALKNDGTLKKDKEKKLLFISYANLFLQDLRDNLDRTSLDLDDFYGTMNPDSWRNFLNFTPVRNYINSYQREKIDKQATKVLTEESKNQRDAVAAKKLLAESEEKVDNSDIVVWLMPQKREF